MLQKRYNKTTTIYCLSLDFMYNEKIINVILKVKQLHSQFSLD